MNQTESFFPIVLVRCTFSMSVIIVGIEQNLIVTIKMQQHFCSKKTSEFLSVQWCGSILEY